MEMTIDTFQRAADEGRFTVGLLAFEQVLLLVFMAADLLRNSFVVDPLLNSLYFGIHQMYIN